MTQDSKTISRIDRPMLALLALLLLVRLVMVAVYPWLVGLVPNWTWENNDGYETIALNCIESRSFAMAPGVPTAERLPLYPGLIAVCYGVAGVHPMLVMLVQALLSTITGYMLFRLAELLFDRRTAIVSLLLFMVHPQVNNFIFRCSTETLFIFVSVMMVYAAVRYAQTGGLMDLIWTAFWLGLSLLTRQTYFLLALTCLPLLVLSRKVRGRSFSSAFRHLGLAAITMVLILSPWIARNYFHSGVIPVLQTWVGQPLFQGVYVSKNLPVFFRGEKSVAELDQDALRMIRARMKSFFDGAANEKRPIAREVMADKFARGLAHAQLLESPASTTVQFFRNLVWAPVLQMTWRSTWVLMGWNWPLIFLSVMGMVRCYRRNFPVFLQALPVVAVFGFLNVLHAIVWPQARYVLPGLIPFSIFAGFAISSWCQQLPHVIRMRQSRQSSTAIAP